MFKYRKKQSGYSLVELMLVMGLLAGMAVLKFEDDISVLEVQKARDTGIQLARYNMAVRSWLTDNHDRGALGTSVSYNGTMWLKGNTCNTGEGFGLNSKPYLPCDFSNASVTNPINFGGLSLNTTIVFDDTVSVVTKSSNFTHNSEVRTDLSGIAAITAMSGGNFTGTPADVVYVKVSSDSGSEIETNAGIITMEAYNTASTDAWLRTDGSNTMKGSISFDDAVAPNRREMLGVSLVRALLNEDLTLGSPGSIVKIDTLQEIAGALGVDALVVNQGNVRVASGNLDVLNGNVNMENGNLRVANGNAYVDRGSVYVRDEVVSERMVANSLHDIQDQGYYVDPAGVSNQGAINTTGHISVGTNLNVANDIHLANGSVHVHNGELRSSSNVVSNGLVYGQSFHDIHNHDRYINPAGWSQIDHINVLGSAHVQARLHANELIYFGIAVPEGGWCEGTGLVGRDPGGRLLSCQGNTWRAQGGSRFHFSQHLIRAGQAGSGVVAVQGGVRFLMCSLTALAGESPHGYVYPADGPDGNGHAVFHAQYNSGKTMDMRVGCIQAI